MDNRLTDSEKREIADKMAFILSHQTQPLTVSERYELNAFRAKAKLEAEEAQNWYLTQMRGVMNYIPQTSIADMQAAQNVGMNTQPNPSYVEDVVQFTNCQYGGMPHDAPSDPIAPFFKLILRQAIYFLLLMLVVGVGLAVLL